ncbi:MAG: hypothetical protein XD93_0480 [candidate division WS6 bacterium 34_10]|uniref:Uncharacterized protein n=1 Tax=candidate division WS6 bacterium 34_10 TaxID=1641389 RepID=A0A117M074_9BACT|nr:MAG: hypothetical protein XD93_0480 [candidate division WS6 bacterium 34_10]
MEDEYILKQLESFNLNIADMEATELSAFLDLARNIKQNDYLSAIDYVNTRRKLADRTAMDKFKYLCGYLQRIKKIYQYQNNYGKSNNR